MDLPHGPVLSREEVDPNVEGNPYDTGVVIESAFKQIGKISNPVARSELMCGFPIDIATVPVVQMEDRNFVKAYIPLTKENLDALEKAGLGPREITQFEHAMKTTLESYPKDLREAVKSHGFWRLFVKQTPVAHTTIKNHVYCALSVAIPPCCSVNETRRSSEQSTVVKHHLLLKFCANQIALKLKEIVMGPAEASVLLERSLDEIQFAWIWSTHESIMCLFAKTKLLGKQQI